MRRGTPSVKNKRLRGAVGKRGAKSYDHDKHDGRRQLAEFGRPDRRVAMGHACVQHDSPAIQPRGRARKGGIAAPAWLSTSWTDLCRVESGVANVAVTGGRERRSLLRSQRGALGRGWKPRRAFHPFLRLKPVALDVGSKKIVARNRWSARPRPRANGFRFRPKAELLKLWAIKEQARRRRRR